MYKKVLCALLAVSMAGLSVGCTLGQGSGETESSDDTKQGRGKLSHSESSEEEFNENEFNSETESKAEIQTSISDDWKDFEFSFMGKDFELPFDYDELEGLGWYANLEFFNVGEDDEDVLESGETIYVPLDNDDYDVTVYVGVVNTGSEDCDVTEGQVYSISIHCDYYVNAEPPALVLSKGITWGSELEEVTAAYGEPSTEPYYSEESDYYMYTYYDDDFNKMDFSIYNDGGVQYIQLTLFDYEVADFNSSLNKSSSSSSAESDTESKTESGTSSKNESKTESNTSSKAAVSSSSSSDKISDNWDSFEFMLDGKLYELTFAYKDLEAAGWSFDLSDYGYDDGYILNKGDMVTAIYLDNDDYDASFEVGIMNSGNKACDITEGQVWKASMSVEYADEDWPELLLPGGITWGATVEDIEKAYGEPTDEPYYSDSLNYYSYEYRTDDFNYLKLTIYDDGGLKEFNYYAYSPEDL